MRENEGEKMNSCDESPCPSLVILSFMFINIFSFFEVWDIYSRPQEATQEAPLFMSRFDAQMNLYRRRNEISYSNIRFVATSVSLLLKDTAQSHEWISYLLDRKWFRFSATSE